MTTKKLTTIGDIVYEYLNLNQYPRHESGLANFAGPGGDEECLMKENIKQNCVGKVVEQQGLTFPPEEEKCVNGRGGITMATYLQLHVTCNCRTKRQYHSVTGGLILNEVFR